MLENVMVRFECGKEDRWSREYGPFDFVQLTYMELRVGPDGDPFAYYRVGEGMWVLLGEDVMYSDVVIFPAMKDVSDERESNGRLIDKLVVARDEASDLRNEVEQLRTENTRYSKALLEIAAG